MMMNIQIPPLDQTLIPQLQNKVNNKTKPLGALGLLETLAIQIGLIQKTVRPVLRSPVVLVFAGDHGVVKAGVSPYPQEVTYQMVLNFLAGGAGINVFARANGLAVRVIDAGVNHAFEGEAGLINVKVAHGTASFLDAPAMTVTQCEQAIAKGIALAENEIAAGSNVLGFGEMGIGNTTAAAAIMAVLCNLPVPRCTGRGTGLDDAGLQNKISVITRAIQLHKVNPQNALQALATFGGFEIAMMAGAMLGAAKHGAVLLIDGFIATAALLVAARMQPNILEYCVFSHQSDEAGHQLLLEQLGARPLLNLGLRLGEGTGAALAYPLLNAAVSFMNEMASFESANVSKA
jgi:nicotinate-nucleotide--dimethylbenzimidazole phosphoribosyltransferase